MSTIEQQLTEATSEIDRLNAQLVSERGAAADALAAEVARTRSLTEVDCYVVEVANHMIDLKHDQGAAEQVRDVHNAKRSDPHPDNEVRVVRLDAYVQQLEAAVMSCEGLHAAQKADLKAQFAQLTKAHKGLAAEKAKVK